MRKLHLFCLLLLVLGACGPAGRSEEALKPPIPVANKNDLNQAVGQDVSVLGKVSHAGKSSSGHSFLNFAANPNLVVFVDAKVVAKFDKDNPVLAYMGKTVVVRGRLEKYRGKLQIRLASPADIEISETNAKPAGEKAERPTAVELKSIGRDAWISPAGLRYVGRDPQGLSRKDHVLRHAKDQPGRDGPHGVFDGGEDLAFAWIDEAWQKAKKEKIRPDRETGRDAYTISMGRRVGYLGGKTGAERRNPPLTKIFIVVREGTDEVITAFPR